MWAIIVFWLQLKSKLYLLDSCTEILFSLADQNPAGGSREKSYVCSHQNHIKQQ